jgi:hypothetical protein
MKKIALCVGINKYPDPRNNLRGCVNDAKDIRKILKNKYGFDKVILLTDRQATYRNIVSKIKWAMLNLDDYGHFAFSISSHGTTIADRNGDEEDRRDEAICLYDRLLVDDNFKRLFKHAPIGMKSTIIADCCHSGSITRATYDNNFGVKTPGTYMKPRYIPPTNDSFAIMSRKIPIQKKMFKSEEDMNEVLITGCSNTEYSYDAQFGNRFNGAMTYTLLKILNEGSNLTYVELYKALRDRLPSSQYPQTPQLEGRKENKNRIIFT